VCHLGRRGARPARREERAYREYASDEQRSPAGCIGVQGDRVIPVRALSLQAIHDLRVAEIANARRIEREVMPIAV